MPESVERTRAQIKYLSSALVLIDTPTDSRGVYTPMTRGRDASHAYVVVQENQTARDVLTQAIGRDWIDTLAVERRAQLHLGRSPMTPDLANQEQPAGLEEDNRRITPGRARGQSLEEDHRGHALAR